MLVRDYFAEERLQRFAASLISRRNITTQLKPLRGGLESSGVAKVEVRAQSNCNLLQVFVVKRLQGRGSREGRVYRAINASQLRSIVPALLGTELLPGGDEYLYLE